MHRAGLMQSATAERCGEGKEEVGLPGVSPLCRDAIVGQEVQRVKIGPWCQSRWAFPVFLHLFPLPSLS